MSLSCPEYIVALLGSLDRKIEQAWWNVYQEEYDSPFQNTGAEFKTKDFEVHAYYWGDDEKLIDRPNFKYKGLEISWYKWYGRGTTINKRISNWRMIRIYYKCVISIRRWEEARLKDSYIEPWTDKEEMKYLRGFCKFRMPFYKRLWLKWKYRNDKEES